LLSIYTKAPAPSTQHLLIKNIKSKSMYVICSDLEGVYVPEVWINVAKKTGIDILKRTTRDEPDYDKLMQWRIGILEEYGLTLKDIQDVIAEIKPLKGAREFIEWMKLRSQLIVVSDTNIKLL